MITDAVRALTEKLAEDDDLPAHIVDLTELGHHVASVRAALGGTAELYYAVKANPAEPVLHEIARHVDGFEIASGGELTHLRQCQPGVSLAFGGPGKTAAELRAILSAAAAGQLIVVHVESTDELRQLAALTVQNGTDLGVLLRINPRLDSPPRTGPAPDLVMGGVASPFGLDDAALAACLPILAGASHLHLRGLHVHLASGISAVQHLALAAQLLAWTAAWERRTGITVDVVTLGGGMAVDYGNPGLRFDWPALGGGLAQLRQQYPRYRLRLEPGRSLTAYAGWYAARVTDVRESYGEWFAVLEGGTHHLRTPATRGHDQPFDVVPVDSWPHPRPRPHLGPDLELDLDLDKARVTLTGALCTPRDVLARAVPVERLRAGDVVVFGLAGAYGWNISHHDFLMHPKPSFHYV